MSKIVDDIKLFCRGVDFEDLGKDPPNEKIVGPLENLCELLAY